jgi:hypothetical protein
MSLIWADNFQSYGFTETYMSDGIYAQVEGSLVSDPDPNETTTVFYFNNAATPETLRFVLPAGATTSGGIGARVWFPVLPSGAAKVDIFTFKDSNNATQVSIAMDSTGTLYAYRGTAASGTALGNSGGPAITSDSWPHIEAKVLISDTVGTVEVRVNGVVKIKLTSQDTKATAIASYSQVGFGNGTSAGASNHYLKDVIVWDTAGSIGNDFFGTVSVFRATETADTSFNWTPSTGSTGYPLIDEATPNDADYISAGTPPPSASKFAMENVPADVTSIKGVVVVGRMRKTDGGDCNVQMALVSGGDTDLGADRPITTAFTYYWDVSELDPDTSAAWTPVGFNAADIQVNRTL